MNALVARVVVRPSKTHHHLWWVFRHWILSPEHVSYPAQLVIIIISSSVDLVNTAVHGLQALELGVGKFRRGRNRLDERCYILLG